MIRVGIIFGGASREREVSFAGGRTVYDNLDKNMFEAVPLFVDARGNFIELNWPFIYRGTIRDFFPPAAYLPESPNNFQMYADSLEIYQPIYDEMLSQVGVPVSLDQLPRLIDVAFLCLHGTKGEDGSIQGLLEWMGIPYTGSGIGPSALGMNKALQKRLMQREFKVPAWTSILRTDWETKDQKDFYHQSAQICGWPLVVKPANQGSSLGVKVIRENDFVAFREAVDAAFFKVRISKTNWQKSDPVSLVRQLSDLREGPGLPLMLNGEQINQPEKLLLALKQCFETNDEALIEAMDQESEVLIEAYIPGREFSCIVLADDEGHPKALPPTEIIKGGGVYTYQSKYLPGLSRKVTPIHTDFYTVQRIRTQCEALYRFFGFQVYARIDGFLAEDGSIFLNDPNTTSGMMPSSFFFHQAAEIGMDPSYFITYILRTSLAERIRNSARRNEHWESLLCKIDRKLEERNAGKQSSQRIAVIMGGYSTERHISVESGRNIYEKLSSRVGTTAIPVFLKGDASGFELYRIPVNMMLKDNADDIREKIEHPGNQEALQNIREEFAPLIGRYARKDLGFEPEQWSFERLSKEADAVFIALHGRPGEDGEIQKKLIAYGIPFNGSGVYSSSLTINKYETNELLRRHGLLVADHCLIFRKDWEENPAKGLQVAENMGFPLIAKPADDGCSSAVKKIRNAEQLAAYARVCFRRTEQWEAEDAKMLNLEEKEEFPARDYFLVETFIDREGADHFLEITGGMLTYFDSDGNLKYEVFEPSEALAEGEVLSLAEKFLAGEGQNITPARFSSDPQEQQKISSDVRAVLEKTAQILNVEGYCRIDAFVRIFRNKKTEVIIIEVNSLPGMTPATCIYHQASINGYKPDEFIGKILDFGIKRQNLARS